MPELREGEREAATEMEKERKKKRRNERKKMRKKRHAGINLISCLRAVVLVCHFFTLTCLYAHQREQNKCKFLARRRDSIKPGRHARSRGPGYSTLRQLLVNLLGSF